MAPIRLASGCICLVAFLASGAPASGQVESLEVIATRRVVGDSVVVPGERLGNVRLGEEGVTLANFLSRFELPGIVGPAGPVSWLNTWNWPTPNFGRSYLNSNVPIEFFFCGTNGKLFAATMYQISSLMPEHPILWLFLRRLKTPEGLTGSEMLPGNWTATYGEVSVITDPVKAVSGHRTSRVLSIFSNGLLARNGRGQLGDLGVYDLGICWGGGTIRGKYIPFFRHVEVKRFFLSKEGDPDKNEIGPPVAEAKFRLRERVYAAVELSFPARGADQPVRFGRIFRSPDGSVAPAWLDRTVKAGETSITIVFHLGLVFPRTTGTWKVEFYGPKETLLATTDFEMTE